MIPDKASYLLFSILIAVLGWFSSTVYISTTQNTEAIKDNKERLAIIEVTLIDRTEVVTRLVKLEYAIDSLKKELDTVSRQ